MFKTIPLLLTDGTVKDFDFMAVGTTQYRYKQVFGKELMVGISRLINQDLSTIGEDADFSVIDKLAFIMNCQAEKKDLNKQNLDTFLEWVEQFEPSSLLNNMNEIISIYIGNKASTSTPKKEVEP